MVYEEIANMDTEDLVQKSNRKEETQDTTRGIGAKRDGQSRNQELLCFSCNGNLSQFPPDIANCPYCGNALKERTSPGMEQMTQPSTATSVKKIRVSILAGQIALIALGAFLLWGSIEVYKSMIAARWYYSGPSPGTLAIPGLICIIAALLLLSVLRCEAKNS